MAHWQLSDHVHLAEVDGDLVFLNARDNRYYCVARPAAASIAVLLSGRLHDDSQIKDLIDDLTAAGLVAVSSAGSGSPPQRLEMTAQADFHDIGAPSLNAGPRSWWRLARAAIEMAAKLAVPRPALWLRSSKHMDGSASVSRVCTLAMQLDRLRPFVPRSGSCLPSSILLLAFLRRHGIRATWVFGVQTFPFEAHCWVEYKGVVLNDTLEHVRWYTPIAIA